MRAGMRRVKETQKECKRGRRKAYRRKRKKKKLQIEKKQQRKLYTEKETSHPMTTTAEENADRRDRSIFFVFQEERKKVDRQTRKEETAAGDPGETDGE